MFPDQVLGNLFFFISLKKNPLYRLKPDFFKIGKNENILPKVIQAFRFPGIHAKCLRQAAW
jgi:hypothetical protein